MSAPRLVAALVVGIGCGTPEDSDIAAFCADAPIVTWDNFGRGFLTENCQTCHAQTSPDRHGAPVDVTFDSEARAAVLRDRMLTVATGDEPTMPPRGGVSDDERFLLQAWLVCDPR